MTKHSHPMHVSFTLFSDVEDLQDVPAKEIADRLREVADVIENEVPQIIEEEPDIPATPTVH